MPNGPMKNLIKKLFALVFIVNILVQSGCNKADNTEYPNVTATADTIFATLKYRQQDTGNDQVVDWPFGTATFSVIVGTTKLIVSTAINTDGTFMLILPATLSTEYMTSLKDDAKLLGGTVKATPDSVEYLDLIQYRVDYLDNGAPKSFFSNLYTVKPDFSVEKSYFFSFYDRAGTFTGTSSTGNIFNWNFTKGWGYVELVKINTSEAFNSRSVTSFPANAIWLN